jgi:hypothetical protein
MTRFYKVFSLLVVPPHRAWTFAKEKAGESDSGVKDLHAKIGRLTMENDFVSVALGRIADTSAKR